MQQSCSQAARRGRGTAVPGAAWEQVQVNLKGDVWAAGKPRKGHRVCVSAPRAIRWPCWRLLLIAGNQGEPVPPQQEMLMHLQLRKSLVGTNPKSWAKALSYLQTLSPLLSCFYCAVVDVSPAPD